MREYASPTVLTFIIALLLVPAVDAAPRPVAEESGYHQPLYTNNIERYLTNASPGSDALTVNQPNLEVDGGTAIITTDGTTDVLSVTQPIRLNSNGDYVQFNGGSLTTDAASLAFNSPVTLQSGTSVEAVETTIPGGAVAIDDKLPTTGAVMDYVSSTVTGSKQDLGYNDLGPHTPTSFTSHEVTITNGSDATIRDYYAQDDQSLQLSTPGGNQYELNITDGFGVVLGQSAMDACSGTNKYLDGEGNCDTVTGGGGNGSTQNLTTVSDPVGGTTELGITGGDGTNFTDDTAATICGNNKYLAGDGSCNPMSGGGGSSGLPDVLAINNTATPSQQIRVNEISAVTDAGLVLNTSTFERGGSGDVWDDGYVDSYDSIQVWAYIDGSVNLSPESFADADLNADGIIQAYEQALIHDVHLGSKTIEEARRQARRHGSTVVFENISSSGDAVVGVGMENTDAGLNVNGTLFLPGGRSDVTGMTQFVKSISGNGNDYSVPTTSAVANYTGGGGTTYTGGDGILIDASDAINVDSPTCDASGDKLLWDGSQFVCGSDTGGGSDQYLPNDPAPSPVDMNNNKIGNVSNPTQSQDAVTRDFMETLLQSMGDQGCGPLTVPASKDDSTWDGILSTSDCYLSDIDFANNELTYVLRIVSITKHNSNSYYVRNDGSNHDAVCEALLGSEPDSSSHYTSNLGNVVDVSYDEDRGVDYSNEGNVGHGDASQDIRCTYNI